MMDNKKSVLRVVAPASSANLGPGFDALGIALSLYNQFTFRVVEKPVRTKGKEHLAITAMRHAYQMRGRDMPYITVQGESGIPVTRGLGSSAACIVAGVVAANVLGQLGLSPAEQLEVATAMEGHPDNVAPAMLGGLVASTTDENGRVWLERRTPHPNAAFYALVPGQPLSTKKSRQILPKRYNRADAVFNISRAILTFAALSEGGNLDNLPAVMQDRLHQPMRAQLVPNFEPIRAACKQAGVLATALSGAGPTILAVARKSDPFIAAKLSAALLPIDDQLQVMPLDVDVQGVRILDTDQ